MGTSAAPCEFAGAQTGQVPDEKRTTGRRSLCRISRNSPAAALQLISKFRFASTTSMGGSRGESRGETRPLFWRLGLALGPALLVRSDDFISVQN